MNIASPTRPVLAIGSADHAEEVELVGGELTMAAVVAASLRLLRYADTDAMIWVAASYGGERTSRTVKFGAESLPVQLHAALKHCMRQLQVKAPAAGRDRSVTRRYQEELTAKSA